MTLITLLPVAVGDPVNWEEREGEGLELGEGEPVCTLARDAADCRVPVGPGESLMPADTVGRPAVAVAWAVVLSVGATV